MKKKIIVYDETETIMEVDKEEFSKEVLDILHRVAPAIVSTPWGDNYFYKLYKKYNK